MDWEEELEIFEDPRQWEVLEVCGDPVPSGDCGLDGGSVGEEARRVVGEQRFHPVILRVLFLSPPFFFPFLIPLNLVFPLVKLPSLLVLNLDRTLSADTIH